MNFFMGKKFVGPGGKCGTDGPEVVIDNGADNNKKMKRMLRPVKFAIILALVGVAALDSFYTLSENEMAVVTTFGRPSSVMTSGPKFKYPFIQKVYKMSKEIKGMPIGYDPDYSSQTGGTPLLNSHINASSRVDDGEGTPENTVSIPSESEMITKDFNFVNTDFYLEYMVNGFLYRISDCRPHQGIYQQPICHIHP